MDPMALMQAAVDVDLDVADVPALREFLGHLTRIESWAAARRVRARRRLDELARAGVPVVADAVLATAGNSSCRDVAKVAGRDGAIELVPDIGDALAAGDVTAGHVDVLANGFRRLEPADRERLAALDGARLARLAQRQSPDEFAKTVTRAVADHQADGGIGLLAQQKRATKLRWWYDEITGMLQLRGEFDPESALKLTGRLRRMVEEMFHGNHPDTCPDDPSLRQDHLQALALIGLVENNTSDGAGGGADVVVVVDQQTLRTGIHPQTILDWGDPDAVLPVETLRRMACLANIIPVVLNGAGVALDEGRGKRLATKEQRRAMRAMYPSCRIPGCRVPFEQCHIHHIRYWEEHLGPSDLDNMIPLCSKHHHAAHEGGWHLQLHPHSYALTITRPDGSIETTGPPRARAG
jgi:hypothetical protein